MAKLVGQPDWQFFDAQGAVLASGTLTFYSPGTTTLKNVYDDTDEAVTLTNPVTLDAAGRVPAPIFGTGSYDVLVKDSGGNTLESISNWGEPESTAEPENVNTISKTSSYTLQAADLANQLTVRIDISSASVAITELALGNMSGTVRYVVVGDDGAGATYSAQVKNSAGTEVWTGYRVGDFIECTYDGTNRTIISERVTVHGEAYMTADDAISASTTEKVFDESYSVDTDIGGWWDSATNHRLDIGFDCEIEIVVRCWDGARIKVFLKKNGSEFYQRYSTQDNDEISHRVLERASSGDYYEVFVEEYAASPSTWQGDAAKDESALFWRVMRRIR